MRKFLAMLSGISIMATLTYTIWLYFTGTPTFLTSLTLPTLPGLSDANTVRYVALGDSYTYGEGVANRDAWPSQLVKLAATQNVQLKLVGTLALSGWKSEDLIAKGLPTLGSMNAQFITIMIGTNDAMQNIVPQNFQAQFEVLLDTVLQHVSAEKILVINIPDYLATPNGEQKASGANPAGEIRDLNRAIQDASTARGIAVVDLSDLSTQMAKNPAMLAADKLHPSAAGHLVWANAIAPTALQLLQH